ncbi:MAG: HD domain-containing protein [Candidatus Nanoarchaeia archaeon]|nr:HD domain-containing protein [Candidatus Nanoarchaeia archaeon]
MKIDIDYAKKFYGNGAHGWDHIQRVYSNALRIAENENCDLEIVMASALLHDIERYRDNEDITLDHAELGAQRAEKLLDDFNYNLNQKENIVYSIRVHRYSKGIIPKTIEAAILQDADRLDALGATIISRLFYNAGKRKGIIHDPSIPPRAEYKGAADITTAINHFYEKILKIKPETFNTVKGKELAYSRYEFTEKFLEQFLKEYNCEI